VFYFNKVPLNITHVIKVNVKRKKERKKEKKYRRYKNYIFKVPPYKNTFTLEFKQSDHVPNWDRD
jgi:hypothetical protein